MTRAYQGRHFRRRSPLRTALELPVLLLVAIAVTLLVKAVLALTPGVSQMSFEVQIPTIFGN